MTTETPSSEFAQVLERICDGSEEAVWEFIDRYGPHIQRVIRRRLNQRLRSKFDSVDFLQMVWASFFADPVTIRRFREPEELIQYLVAVARNKVIDETRRRLQLQRHNVGDEVSLDEPSQPSGAQATPSQIAIARERWETMLDQSNSRNRQIVELRMQGASYVEIGRELRIHPRTAREVIANLVDLPAG